MSEKSKLKIFLVGAHSTGKTTILEHIYERYNINKIHETAREIIQKYGGSLKDIRCDLELSKRFQRDIIEQQIEKEKRTDNPFIADRGLDIIAYFCEHTLDTSEILSKDYVREYLNKYKDDESVVFFIRPEKCLIEDDGVREDLSPEDIYKMDGIIKYILESYNINYITLRTKNLNERIRAVQTVLELEGIR